MRNHAGHLSDHELLLAVDRELPARQQASADAHLGACDPCRARRTRLERVSAAVAESCRDASPDAAGRGEARYQLRARLAEIADGPSGSIQAWPPPVRMSGWAMAGVAVVAVVLLMRVVTPFEGATGAGERLTFEAGALPVAALTPGATWNVTAGELCGGGGRERRTLAVSVRHQVLRAYAMEAVPDGEYELDYLITPELGGAPDAQNLWPQRYASRTWNAHVKDQLEQLLPRLVCDGTVPLRTAQRDIATDWIAAYRKYFRTDTPLRQHALLSLDGVGEPDEDVITYPVWRPAAAPALELISFSASR